MAEGTIHLMLVLIQIVIWSLEVYRKLFTVALEEQIVKNCAALAETLLPPRISSGLV